jgi:hypothetical protein
MCSILDAVAASFAAVSIWQLSLGVLVGFICLVSRQQRQSARSNAGNPVMTLPLQAVMLSPRYIVTPVYN